jgi:hypothetical protein
VAAAVAAAGASATQRKRAAPAEGVAAVAEGIVAAAAAEDAVAAVAEEVVAESVAGGREAAAEDGMPAEVANGNGPASTGVALRRGPSWSVEEQAAAWTSRRRGQARVTPRGPAGALAAVPKSRAAAVLIPAGTHEALHDAGLLDDRPRRPWATAERGKQVGSVQGGLGGDGWCGPGSRRGRK